MRLETLGELIEACTSEYMKTYNRLRVLGGSLEILEGLYSTFRVETVAVIVKSMREVSVDEVPLLNSIISALTPHNIDVRFYEYDMLVGDRGRYELFSSIIEKTLRENLGLVAVTPYLMPVAIVSRLSNEAMSMLDNATSISINVRYENLLYIPEGGEEVEVIGKENSASSLDRIEWIKKEAEKRGFRKILVKLLSDNKSIFDYVTSAGPKGIYKRVPVTKLASYIVALARCYELEGIDEVIREEEARHMIYTLNIPESIVNSIIENLKSEFRDPKLAIPREPYNSWILQGSRRVMRELIRRYGLE
ncbi:MAG: hypothetical protein QXU90_01270 [Acidilobaceae archaeon]